MADAPPSFTVVDATGTAVGRTISVQSETPIVLLTVGGREVKLEVFPNRFGRVLEVSGFSAINPSSCNINDQDGIYPDSLDCSGNGYLRQSDYSPALLPYACAHVSTFDQVNDQNIPVGNYLSLLDPQTPARILSAGAVYSVRDGSGSAFAECSQHTVPLGEELPLLDSVFPGVPIGFVPPFRLQ